MSNSNGGTNTVINPEDLGWIQIKDFLWMKQLSDTSFHLVGVQTKEEESAIVSEKICLEDYCEEDIEDLLSGVYCGVSPIISQNSDKENGYIAECIFQDMEKEPLRDYVSFTDDVTDLMIKAYIAQMSKV